MQPPRISVIIALLNRRATLARCIDSVLAQSYANREVIVMDGGSVDGSIELLRSYPTVQWESEPDRGLYHALNKALSKARGDWIYVLGADDYLWDTQVFSRMAPHLEAAYPPARVVYAQANFVSARGEVLEVLGEPWDRFRSRFLEGFMIPHQAVFHHRSLFEVHGTFNESFRTSGDYEMLLRELKQGDARFVSGVVVAGYQFGGGSTVVENTLRVLRERRLAWRLNGVPFPGLRWRLAEARSVARVCLWRLLGERLAKRVLDLGRALLGKPAFWTRV